MGRQVSEYSVTDGVPARVPSYKAPHMTSSVAQSGRGSPSHRTAFKAHTRGGIDAGRATSASIFYRKEILHETLPRLRVCEAPPGYSTPHGAAGTL